MSKIKPDDYLVNMHAIYVLDTLGIRDLTYFDDPEQNRSIYREEVEINADTYEIQYKRAFGYEALATHTLKTKETDFLLRELTEAFAEVAELPAPELDEEAPTVHLRLTYKSGAVVTYLCNFDRRSLPKNFVRDVIMKKPSKDMMNTLSRSVLSLYSYDDNPDDISEENVLRQCLQLIAMFPLLSVYGYNAYRYYYKGESLIIHPPRKDYSTAENMLHCLRDDSKFTPLEAKLLDVSLILHMEHGGGNNSTFTTHLVSSSGTDTYSAIAAAIGSLKGPRHGGANIKVVKMFDDMRKHVKDYTSETRPASSTVSATPSTPCPTPGPRPSRATSRSWSTPRAGKKTMPSTRLLPAWPRRSSPRSGKSTRASAATSTSTRASFTRCWACPWSSSPPSSPSPGLRAGAPTAWRKSATTTRSCGRPT